MVHTNEIAGLPTEYPFRTAAAIYAKRLGLFLAVVLLDFALFLLVVNLYTPNASLLIATIVMSALASSLFFATHLLRSWGALRRQYSLVNHIPVLPKGFSIGKLNTDWLVLASARYTWGRIRCLYTNQGPAFVPEFEQMKQELCKEPKKNNTEEGIMRYYNAPMSRLEAFDTSLREMVDGEEVPILVLKFGVTDYFTYIVTNLNIHNFIRQHYAEAIDPVVQPVPEFANPIVVMVNLITRDGYLIVRENLRPHNLTIHRFNTAVSEYLIPSDIGSAGAPDPFRCAVRGALEEIGVAPKPENIEFTAFGVQMETRQYELIGWGKLEETRDEIIHIENLRPSAKQWEGSRLQFIPCNPTSVANFVLSNWQAQFPVTQADVVAIVMSLFQIGFSVKEVNQVFLQE